MKVFIIYELIDEPTGGGNQFLKMLKKELELQGALSNTADQADVLLFNSHHFLDAVSSYKKSFPTKKFVHRIDGPMRLYGDPHDPRDPRVYLANEMFADATVYQSKWSMNKNLEMGLKPNKLNTVIQNCADDKIFFPNKNSRDKEKIRIFSSSWSKHFNKGFEFYKKLDEKLDFNKYEYFFAGSSPIDFRNIKNLGPLKSEDLANELRKSDIFVTASKNDPCSNALIEAASCGLKCLALNSGGHPEIAKDLSFLFNNEFDFFTSLDSLLTNKTSIKIRKPKDIALEYIYFFNSIV